MSELHEKICHAVQEADAILIGASNGLSISEGYNIFTDNKWFQENFGDFRSRYNIRSILQGCYFSFPSPEETWAFWSRLISRVSYMRRPSRMMQNLYALASSRDYFVVTSNTEDHFAPAGFARDKIFEMEGRVTLFRCSRGCCEDVTENREDILRLTAAEKGGRVPSDLVPRCPKCGAPMTIHIADSSAFFQTADFRRKMQRYQNFIQKYHNRKLVILEFGVGWRNRMIKEPLMRLAAAEPQAVYITFNKGELYIPEEIRAKSIGVDEDIATALEAVRAVREKAP